MDKIQMKNAYRRIEPIFNLKTPVLFAHRGGVLEAPESTIKGFKYALEIAGADILEIDIQLTKDGEFVVWHGPDLDNVRIENQDNRPSKRLGNRKDIGHFEWNELNKKAWVADPNVKCLARDKIDLSDVPMSDDRHLISLSELLGKFPDIPINMDMKESFVSKINNTDRKNFRDNIKSFSGILRNDPGKRKIVVASATHTFIKEFRKLNKERFPTGLSMFEQLLLKFMPVNFKNRALETSHYNFLSSKRLIKKVRNSGGSTFVFLTSFGPLLPSIDKHPIEKNILALLDRGVDGIMTDRPLLLRQIMDTWIRRKEE
jgi:glycerophosphoryl diester phosphodiesterase